MEAVVEANLFTVEVGPQGELKLPAQALARLKVESGDTLNLVSIDSMLVVTAKPLVVPEMADKIAALLEARGMTLDDLLAGLERAGKEVFEEQYGPVGVP